jgi:hypothetical protein
MLVHSLNNMSTEPDPNQSASPSNGASEAPKNQDAAAKDAAAQALGQAKEKMSAGVDVFKKQDVRTQIYLAGLAVTVLCSFIFGAISVSMKVTGPMADIVKQQGNVMTSVTIFDAGANGKLAVLAAMAGIGLWVWNFMAKKKEAWAPLALAGSAGLCALLLLVLWLRSGTSSSSALGVHVSVSMTLLGFWLPFAGAIAATVVSVKRILNPTAAPAE